MMKKLMLFLLTICLAASVFAVTALAAEPIASGTCGENLTWTLDDTGTLTISGTGEMADFSSGKAPWYSWRISINTVVIEDGVTSIGFDAFSECENMTSVSIPDSVTSIEPFSFFQCICLTKITIPENVTSIGRFAFCGCYNLTDVTLPEGLTSIEGYTFSSCDRLTNINIPDGITSIGNAAFHSCENLTNIIIPDSITSIADNGFSFCDGLKLIHYIGTEEQKNAIEIDDNYMAQLPWHCGVTASEVAGQTVYYCPECDVRFLADGSAYYGVIVGGVNVTPDNCADILGDGTASYDFDTNTLTLTDANITVTGQDYGIYAEGDLIIHVNGTSTIKVTDGSGIRVANGDLKIAGNWLKMTVSNQTKAEAYGIFCDGSFTKEIGALNLDVEADSAALAYGMKMGGDVQLCRGNTYLRVINADENYGIYSTGTINYIGGTTDVSVYMSDGTEGTTMGVFADRINVTNGIFEASGDISFKVTTGISIAEGIELKYAMEEFVPDVPCTLTSDPELSWYANCTLGYTAYEISVGNVGVTSVNKDDVLGDGTVRYDPKKDTIYLNNAHIEGDIWCEYGYTIHLTGSNSVTAVYAGEYLDSRVFAMGAWNGVTICGDGSLDLYLSAPTVGEAYCIDVMGKLNIRDCQLNITVDNVTAKQSAMGILGIEEINIENAEVNVNVISESGKHRGIVSTMGAINILNSTVSSSCDGLAFYSGKALNLGSEHTVTGAVEVYHPGITGDLTQADPDVPVVIAPKTVVVPTLCVKSFSLSFEDEVLVNFYYTAENTQDIVEQGMLVFNSNPGVADIALADHVYVGSVASNGGFANTSKGIAAQNMGDERYYCAYAKLSDGTYAYSSVYDYSPKKYALGRIEKSSNEKLKSACVAMLNYGAAAQLYFNYRTDDLMNAGLTEAQQALAVEYDPALFTGSVAADTAKTVHFTKTQNSFSKLSASVSFESAFAINYYFTPKETVAGEMTLYIWSPEIYKAVDVLTVDNAVSVTMESKDGAYYAPISGIAPKNVDETYYVAGVYTDTNGNTHCTGVIAYSISRYCMNNAYGSMGNLAQATAMYGYYAKQYFA